MVVDVDRGRYECGCLGGSREGKVKRRKRKRTTSSKKVKRTYLPYKGIKRRIC